MVIIEIVPQCLAEQVLLGSQHFLLNVIFWPKRLLPGSEDGEDLPRWPGTLLHVWD